MAPDYLLLHRSVKDAFVREYRRALEEFFPGGDFGELPRIVNDKHFRRADGLLAGQRVLVGGERDAARRFIPPTLLDETDPDAPAMQEEIFAPILPMLCWQEREEVVRFIQSRPKPLALYLFTRDREMEREIFDRCSFGGGCVNDTIVHLACSGLPFGGVGNSGMGSYHGKQSFDTFTHYRSVLKKTNWLDLAHALPPLQRGEAAVDQAVPEIGRAGKIISQFHFVFLCRRHISVPRPPAGAGNTKKNWEKIIRPRPSLEGRGLCISFA